MVGVTGAKHVLRMATLLILGAQFRQSHGREFAKSLIVQLGADDGTLGLFECPHTGQMQMTSLKTQREKA